MEETDATESQSAVSCNELVVAYGATTAVDRLSFAADRGQIVALLGPNGAGKTSTIEAIEGYRQIRSGTVRVLGLDPEGQHADLVPRIGVMLQQDGVYPLLGPAQVLRLFASYYPGAEDPDALLDLVGLTAVRATPWRRLSGGERRRLSLALALVGRPEVAFLDEPTSGVDPEGRVLIRAIVDDLRQRGLCVVLSTHELAEAERLADQVVIVDGGRKLAEGSPAELRARTAEGSIRFSTDADLDLDALAVALGNGTIVERDGTGSYRLRPPQGTATSAVVAVLARWLADRDLSLSELRTGHSLEEAYLSITAGHRQPVDQLPQTTEPGEASGAVTTRNGRSGGRRRRRRAVERDGR